MITTQGSRFIKQFLAGQSTTVIGYMSVGVGDTAASASDTDLNYELSRVPVSLRTYDPVSDRLVFKGTFPEELAGRISEVALWTAEADVNAASTNSRQILTFESDAEEWDSTTYQSGNTRIGKESLRLSTAASATNTKSLSDVGLDFSSYNAGDTFNIAYYVNNANVASVSIRFETDASNYYFFTTNTPTSGYKLERKQKGSAGVVGSPDWSSINSVKVLVTATGGGSTYVDMDGVRIENNSPSPEYGMISRYLPTPIVKESGVQLDFEYALNVSV